MAGGVHFWVCFRNMNFKMSLIYPNGYWKNSVGGTGPQFKVVVYVEGINFGVVWILMVDKVTCRGGHPGRVHEMRKE